MPVAVSYPGVYVEEIPSGVHPIAGVPTAVAAVIGRFPMGPMDTAVEVLSFADVERQFGGLTSDSDASFALSQYFLNGGARAWVVRVAAPTPAPATNPVPDPSAGTAFTVTALSPGTWGNWLQVQVIGPDSATFDLVVSLVGADGSLPAIQQQEVFPGLSAATADKLLPNYITTAVNGVSQLITVAEGSGEQPAPTGLLSTALGSGFALDVTAVRSLDVTINATTSTVTIPASRSSVTTIDLEETAAALQGAIRAANGADSAWSQAIVRALPAAQALQILSGGADDGSVAVAVSATDSATLGDLGLDPPDNSEASAIRLATGDDGGPPTALEIVGSEAGGTGMHALENTDFTLLCLPSIGNQVGDELDTFPAADYSTVIGNAIAYCESKRAVLLLDPPDTAATQAPSQLRTWLTANSFIRSEYSALYYPRLTIADPTRNFVPRSIGPCGTIAGLMGRTDADRGVWKSPAGTTATLVGLQQLDYLMTDAENGVLNPIAVNCLRTFPAYGTVSWGARTLDGSDAASSDYKYVAIRRLANFLESSLLIGLQWAVFEPNDEPLWSQVRLNVGSFLQGLFLQGAFAGATPKDAYVVKCDSTTTTPTDQALGVVNVLVGFAPLRPAEFVVLQIQQLAGQTQS
jgi:uncharacterized protein